MFSIVCEIELELELESVHRGASINTLSLGLLASILVNKICKLIGLRFTLTASTFNTTKFVICEASPENQSHVIFFVMK